MVAQHIGPIVATIVGSAVRWTQRAAVEVATRTFVQKAAEFGAKIADWTVSAVQVVKTYVATLFVS